MADGKIQIQSTDNRIYTVTPEVGAGGNVALTLPKEGGMLATEVYAVSKTGNETIAGVKTFSSSPIVPTPTTDDQAANKLYVTNNAGISLATANTYDIGVGQTWQDVTASRVSGTTYTNSTGKPIFVSVRSYTTAPASTTFTCDSKAINTWGSAGNTQSCVGIVPNNSTYRVDATGIYSWIELR